MSDMSLLSVVLVALVVLVVSLVGVWWLVRRVPIHKHLRGRHAKFWTVLGWHVAHVRWLHVHVHVRGHRPGIALHLWSPLRHHLRRPDTRHELIWRWWSALVRHVAILGRHSVPMHASINWVLIPIWWHLITSRTHVAHILVQRHRRLRLHCALLLLSCSLILAVYLSDHFFQECL